MDDIHSLLVLATDEISSAVDLASLDSIRIKYLGKKGLVTDQLKQLSSLTPEDRPKYGQAVNEVKIKLQSLLVDRANILKRQEILKSLEKENVDVTLPGLGNGSGTLHPITRVEHEVENFFINQGFKIAEGPEIEDDYHNFTALNFPEHHPARYMQDTFYFPDGKLLRTHTSPMQVRIMENYKPPLAVIVPGRVFRCDSDATHSPMFHQIEGFVIAEGITFADLKGTLERFLKFFFGEDIKFRFRPSFFPFTEPSAEIDIWWQDGENPGRWLEICGSGMIHPNVLKAGRIDSEVYSGFAFGMGLDRLAMLKFGVNDLRLFFENDLRFLLQ